MNIPTRYNPGDIEERWYSIWENGGYFHPKPGKSPKGSYTIVIPPPNVTGILHMGHGLNMTLQDIIIRFKRMQGFDALWLPGCDHAGIATEMKVKGKLHEEGKTKHDLGREKFVEEVLAWKKQYGGTIMKQLRRLGCSCDWQRERFTLDEGLSRSVREVFVRLYEKGLIYRAKDIVNWCPKCGTTLSDIEVNREDQQGFLWHVNYPLTEGGGHITIATTRPETILADVAIAVNPKDERYKNLVGKKVRVPIAEREIPIIADEMVEIDFGTGALKITPAHDKTDRRIGVKHDLPAPCVITEDGRMNDEAMHFAGMDRFECREKFVEELRQKGHLEKIEDYTNNIGQCYRCDAVIEPYLSDQWFVKMKPLAEAGLAAVRGGDVHIKPERWEKVYYNWLENILDWPISRQLWWGHRIPVWNCLDCGEPNVAREAPKTCAKCDSENLAQEEDVLDTWFSSWLWPFSTLGWPDETPDLKAFYPTDVLVTAYDIIFFWVARMVMGALEFTGTVPFRDVYIHGLVCDDNGQKMDKSRGNIIDPIEMIEKYGADAVRFTMALIATEGQNMRLESTRFEMGRNFNNKLWNVSRFVLMNLERGTYCLDPKKLTDLKDRWIVSSLNTAIRRVTKLYESYRFSEAANLLYDFVWHSFCDWYIELAKPDLDGEDKEKAHNTRCVLVFVLDKCLRTLHPIMPFISEEIWQRLRSLSDNICKGETIVLAPWPLWDETLISKDVEDGFNLLIEITRGIRKIRRERGMPERKEIDVTISTREQPVEKAVKKYTHYFRKMAGVGSLEIGLNLPRPKGCAVGVVGGTQIFIPLDAADISAEISRLEKERAKARGFLVGIDKRLGSANFVERADPKVVEGARQQKEDLLRQIEALERNISNLGAE